jgi:predicted double-glycine peptidase
MSRVGELPHGKANMIQFPERIARIFGLPAMLVLFTALGCTSPVPGEHHPAAVLDPGHGFTACVWSETAVNEENVVMQRHDYSCGPAALATIVQYYWGDAVSEDDFIHAIMANLSMPEREERVKNGLSMTDLRLAAVRKGYFASIGTRTVAQLAELKVPVILRIKTSGHEHFVVYRGMVEDRVFLADPIHGNIRVSFDKFTDEWNNRAILVVAKPTAEPPKFSPLLIEPHEPVQPELQVARNSLFYFR